MFLPDRSNLEPAKQKYCVHKNKKDPNHIARKKTTEFHLPLLFAYDIK